MRQCAAADVVRAERDQAWTHHSGRQRATFFLYDTTKILLLLCGIMFVVGFFRASLDVNRARNFLAGKNLFVGLVLAVALTAGWVFSRLSLDR